MVSNVIKDIFEHHKGEILELVMNDKESLEYIYENCPHHDDCIEDFRQNYTPERLEL